MSGHRSRGITKVKPVKKSIKDIVQQYKGFKPSKRLRKVSLSAEELESVLNNLISSQEEDNPIVDEAASVQTTSATKNKAEKKMKKFGVRKKRI